ncbi:hypothetical protein FOZ62_019554 [Perkinsus olseni]|uniref:4-nitrophenylphosphatase n=1 Tax=Perkinsus olseni TaxID=32597 RepID=A0A7J6RUE1_PEROL|nr:hypothetical protein FOZ62_019554 [Perkinsus olseni]
MNAPSASTHVTSVHEIVANHDTFIFDCDGVIWQGGCLIPGVDKFLKSLQNAGKKYVFVTNTSSRSREEMWAKFADIGLGDHCSKEMMYPSCYFTARVIQKRHPNARRMYYVVGGSGLIQELEALGISCVTDQHGACDEPLTEERFKSMAEEMEQPSSARIDGIVVGWDLSFSFQHICRASLAFQLADEDFFFYATNDDSFDRIGPWKIPATGAILASLNAVARISERPDAEVLGKPNPEFLQFVMGEQQLDASRSVVIGDRLDTDILMAKRAGVASCLALSGCCSKVDLDNSSIAPDYVIDSAGAA